MSTTSKKPIIIAIDLGSSRTHCIAIDPRGKVVGQAAVDTQTINPESLAPLGKEYDADQLWSSIITVVKTVLRKCNTETGPVIAVAATSQRQGMVLLDAVGKELHIGPNTDLRAFMEGQVIDHEHGSEVYRTTGHTPSFLFTPAKLRWFQEHRPEIFGNVQTVLSIDAWITYKLSGELAMERTAAAEIGLLDVESGTWATELLTKLGLTKDFLPPLVEAGTRIGSLSTSAATATGMPQNTPVISGGPDTQSALLGLGSTAPGEIGVAAGWSAPTQIVLDHFLLDEAVRTWTSQHIVPGKWTIESNATEAGSALRWITQNLNVAGGKNPYDVVDQLAASSPPGSRGAVAFLGPRTSDMGNVGPRWGGFLFPLLSQTMPIDRADMFRAALENLAFAIRSNLTQLQEVSSKDPVHIRIGGGMARSKVLTQILADVLGRQLGLPANVESAAIGAAMCASTGVGLHASINEASKAMWRAAKPIEPDPLANLEYEEHYSRWLVMGSGLENMADQL